MFVLRHKTTHTFFFGWSSGHDYTSPICWTEDINKAMTYSAEHLIHFATSGKSGTTAQKNLMAETNAIPVVRLNGALVPDEEQKGFGRTMTATFTAPTTPIQTAALVCMLIEADVDVKLDIDKSVAIKGFDGKEIHQITTTATISFHPMLKTYIIQTLSALGISSVVSDGEKSNIAQAT